MPGPKPHIKARPIDSCVSTQKMMMAMLGGIKVETPGSDDAAHGKALVVWPA